MVNDLPSKFAALLEKEKRRFDRTLGNDLRELRATYGGGSLTVLLMQQRYETDIEERLSTLLTTLKRLLASSSEREVRDNKPDLERLAQAWLQSHIEDCQSHLNEHVAKIGPEGSDQYDLGRDRILNALAVELDLLSVTDLSVIPLTKPFDVFISHTSRDKTEARRLAETLRSSGLAVWFDEWELVAGSPWQDALEDAIASSSSMLIVIGADGLGPWQQTETAAALGYMARDRRPVIPVLLPGSRLGKLPPFLRDITSVEIKSWQDSDFTSALKRIIWGITGRPPILPERDRIPKVFLCHAKEDDSKVRELYFRLRDLGLDPWYDKEKLVVGDRWEQEIIDAIESTDFFAICLSARSVGKTGFIQREIKVAVKEYQRRPQQLAYLLPVRLEPCEVPRLKLDDNTTLSDLHWIDLFEDENDALNRFVDGVRKQFGRGHVSTPNTASAPVE